MKSLLSRLNQALRSVLGFDAINCGVYIKEMENAGVNTAHMRRQAELIYPSFAKYTFGPFSSAQKAEVPALQHSLQAAE